MNSLNTKKLIIIALLSICFSCKKSADTLPDIPAGTKLSEVSISITGTKASSNVSYAQGNGVYNLLGYGYDVTGKFEDTSAVRAQVVDIALFDKNNPARVMVNMSKQAGPKIINPESAKEFAAELSNNLNETAGFNYFKGTITSAFPQQDALSGKYLYATYSEVIQQKRIQYDQVYDLLMPCLTSQFVTDVKILTAEELVRKYGTHVLSDIVLGAKFNVIYQATPIIQAGTLTQTSEFSYEFDKTFGLFSGSLDPVDASSIATLSSPKFAYQAIGADPSKLKVNTTSAGTKVDITAWHLSSTEENAVFVEISNKGLISLDQLITDLTKKAAVKDFIASYLQQQQVK